MAAGEVALPCGDQDFSGHNQLLLEHAVVCLRHLHFPRSQIGLIIDRGHLRGISCACKYAGIKRERHASASASCGTTAVLAAGFAGSSAAATASSTRSSQ